MYRYNWVKKSYIRYISVIVPFAFLLRNLLLIFQRLRSFILLFNNYYLNLY